MDLDSTTEVTEQQDEIEEKGQAKNIKRTTELKVKKFEKWCAKKNIVDL